MEKGMRNLIGKMKQMKKNQWLILVLTGILLLVIAIPVPEGNSNKKEEVPQTETSSGPDEMETIEKRLENALTQVAGVGKVKVLITRKSSGEKIVEKDIPVTDRNTQEEDSDGGTRSTKEKTTQEATVYTQDGSGGQTPYVIEEMEPQIQGIVIVAEGGDNSLVVQNITEAVEALFGVEAHKIKVMKMN